MSKRGKNEDRLCTGFYQAHDFLNFDLKKYKSNVKPLMKINRLGIDMPPPEFIEGPYSKEGEAAWDLLNWYAKSTHEEYDRWLDSLKFQYKHTLLHELLPPNQVLNDFFEDLHIRVPHEKTLLIMESEEVTCIVSVEEIDTKRWILQMRKKLGVKMLKSHPFKKLQKQVSGWESETILQCRLTVNTNIRQEHIYKPKRFSKETLDAVTKSKTFHYPSAFLFPCGGTIKEFDKIKPIVMHDVNSLAPNGEYAWFQAYTSPVTTPPIEGEYIAWDDKKSMKQAFSNYYKLMQQKMNHNKNVGYQSSYGCLWDLVGQAVVHISILTHPDFKDFCVNMLQKKGHKPYKNPYDIKNPYKNKPGWRPPFEHYVVTINVPDDVSLEENSSTHKKRHHLVRGHLMRSKGKNAVDGFVWRRSHWRGNKELGTVTKDYVMDVDERVRKAI